MRSQRQSGFSLIEIIVVLATIALLATIAIPSYQRISEEAESVVVAKDLRTLINAIDLYGAEYTRYPASMSNAEITPEMARYLPPRWQTDDYNWQFTSGGGVTFVFVYDLPLTSEQRARIDRIIDDNNVGAGDLWAFGGGFVYFFESNFASSGLGN